MNFNEPIQPPTDGASANSAEHVCAHDPRNWYELGEWFDPGEGGPDATHGDNAVRIAFVYDSEWVGGDNSSRGVVTYCADGSEAARLLSPIVTDPRWRCANWLRHASEFIESVAAHLTDQGFVFVGDPAVRAIPPRDGGLLSYVATWDLAGGDSVSAMNHADIGCCGKCHGCRNSVDAGNVGAAAAESWVYFVQAKTGGPVKIGRSAAPRARVASLQTANAAELCILATMPGGAAVERTLHTSFAADRVRPGGEWFRPSPALVAFIRELGGRPT